MSATVSGTCDAKFSRIREIFEGSFEKGEIGAGVAVMIDGDVVVDLWGGFADEAKTRPWQRDTIVNTYSTTKGMSSVCLNRLIERGLLDLDTPVATYWPEFAQNGKQDIPMRLLISHQAGLPQLTKRLPRELSNDWTAVTTALAEQEPMWEPGSQQVYHATTWGFLNGEVLRRIDGRTIGTYLREEVCGPLVADFLLGFGAEHDGRCADLVQGPPIQGPMMEARMRAAAGQQAGAAAGQQAGAAAAGAAPQWRRGGGTSTTMTPEEREEYNRIWGPNSRNWRSVEIPAANGHGTAMGIARVYAALARGGELDGVQVLKPDTLDGAVVQIGKGTTSALMSAYQLRFGTGFMLTTRPLPGGGSVETFGHAGMGGSSGFADRERKLSFGYVMNRMNSGFGFALTNAVYECLA